MKTFVFIGNPKVGSTSLQYHFATHVAQYLPFGIVYPFVDAVGVEWLLRQINGGASRQPHISAREPHNALALQLIAENNPKRRVPEFHQPLPPSNDQLGLMRAQVSGLDANAALFASEIFTRLALEAPNELAVLRTEAFSSDEVHLIAVFRRPDEQFHGWYGQLLTLGARIERPDNGGLDRLFSTAHFRYQESIEAWMQEFPKAQLHLAYYPEVVRAGGLVTHVRNIMRRAGVTLPNLQEADERQNTSVHPLHLDAVRRLVNDGYRVGPQGRRILADRSHHRIVPPAGDIEVLGQSLRDRIARDFTPQVEWFEARFASAGLFGDHEEIRVLRQSWWEDVLRDPEVADQLGLDPRTLAFLPEVRTEISR